MKEKGANLASVCRLLTVLLHASMLGFSNSAVPEGSSGFSLETLYLTGGMKPLKFFSLICFCRSITFSPRSWGERGGEGYANKCSSNDIV